MFELLFSHMALNLFTEPDQTIDILKVQESLNSCSMHFILRKDGFCGV